MCPYHQWTYSQEDGALVSAREMHADFDPSWYGLKPVPVAEWNDLIFLCFAEHPAQPVETYMTMADWGGYGFGTMKLAATKTHEIAANWKVVVENNLECYHCAVNHPEFMEIFDWRSTAAYNFDDTTSSRLDGNEVSVTFSSVKTCKRVCDIPAPRLHGSEAGDPFATVVVSWEPGVLLVMRYDYVWIFVPKPIAPHRTELRQYWLVSSDAEEGRDYKREEVMAIMDATMQQDRALCELVQQGMTSPAYTPGPLNRIYQAGQAAFYLWYMRQIQSRFPETPSDGGTGRVG